MSPDPDFLPFARPSITEARRHAVLEVLDSGWLTTGARTKRVRGTLSPRSSARRHAVALNSATAALHLALEALGVGPGDEVIVPTWTFAATAEVVIYLGARPVLVDVDRRDAQRDARDRARCGDTAHEGGHRRPHRRAAVDIERLVDAARRRGIAVVEDAAHAFPSRIGGARRPPCGHVRRGWRVLLLRHQDDHDRRGRDAGDGRRRDRRPGPADVAARHQPRRLEPLRGERLVVLRDRGRRASSTT